MDPGDRTEHLAPAPDRGPAEGTLGQFLRSRRARLTPEQVGLVSYGPRRVPGLRREELAQLAGVSTTYYTRLEQDQNHQVSPSVIDGLARALRLADDERAHLHHIAAPRPRRWQRPATGTVRASTVRLLDAMADVPAVLMDRLTTVLAWNPLGHALLAGHLDRHLPERAPERPNLTRLMFLDPATGALYADWAAEAALAVASLRSTAGRYRADPTLADLVGELSVRSDTFARLWSSHPVKRCTSGRKHFHHPLVGGFEMDYTLLHVPDGTGQRLEAFTATDQRSTDAVQLLASLSTQTAAERGPVPGRTRERP